jgi:hypothetical protein
MAMSRFFGAMSLMTAADANVALRHILKARDHPQRRVLPQPDGPTSATAYRGSQS